MYSVHDTCYGDSLLSFRILEGPGKDRPGRDLRQNKNTNCCGCRQSYGAALSSTDSQLLSIELMCSRDSNQWFEVLPLLYSIYNAVGISLLNCYCFVTSLLTYILRDERGEASFYSANLCNGKVYIIEIVRSISHNIWCNHLNHFNIFFI